MADERLHDVLRIYEAALAREGAARGVYLDAECGADAALRREVETLLAEPSAGSHSPLDTPPAAHPAIRIGQHLGPYKILAPLGAGGMGEVYKARDTRLKLDVAIKVLPALLADDPERRRRFEHEAQAIAALDHPHICAIHYFGSQDGVDFLVMAYLDGQTLAARLRRGPLSLAQALELGAQVADALAAAHRHHIIHRDLKPANIMLVKTGAALQAKLLDFGLAKLRAERDPGVALSSAPTEAPMTAYGAVMGTVPYMAPEQLEGKETDARTDIFALGCVLFELLTGRRAFEGITKADLTAAILEHEPPPVSALRPATPPALDRLVRHCLAKDPDARWQDAADVAEELRGISQDAVATEGGRAAARPERPRRRARAWAVAGGALLLAGLAGGAWLGAGWRPGLRMFGPSPSPAKLTEKDPIVLADFDNKTGDAIWDDTLKQGLSVELAQSPFLSLLSDQRVDETLKQMGGRAGDRLTAEVTREVCLRTGSAAMLTGSIASLGGQYVIGLKAVTCSTGDVLAQTQEQPAEAKAVLTALHAAALKVRSTLGESLSSVQKYATPLEQATTPSLEALKAFSLGVKTNAQAEGTQALPFFQRAVDLDPNFAMAYARMSLHYWALTQEGPSAVAARTAYALREKVSERERLLIEGDYFLFATGELEKAAQAFSLWKQIYPREATPYGMGVYVYGSLGDWERALGEAREELRLEPQNVVAYVNVGCALTSLNQLDEAEAVYQKAVEQKLGNEFLRDNRYQLAFLKGDAAQMAQLASAAMGTPGAEDNMLALQADTEGWHGKLTNARELTRRAEDSARRHNARESAAVYQAEAALREVEAGERGRARAEALAAVKLAPNRDVRAMAALALARAGETAEAERAAAGLEKSYPLNTLIQSYWLPSIRAAVALDRHEPNKALELLKAASPIELGISTNLFYLMAPVYLRGEAYLMAADGNRAAGEFQKFIDHRGVVINFPWGAMARLGLARAYALQGDTVKARAAYQDFLEIWKDADPDLPVLKAAKAEFAKLAR